MVPAAADELPAQACPIGQAGSLIQTEFSKNERQDGGGATCGRGVGLSPYRFYAGWRTPRADAWKPGRETCRSGRSVYPNGIRTAHLCTLPALTLGAR